MNTKTCTKCGETKDVSEFFKSKDKKDGISPRCKACDKEKINAWRAANPDKVKAQAQAWDAAHACRQELRPSYIASKLNIPVAILTPELLELKRQQLLNHRAMKALTSTLKDLDE